MGKKHGIYKYEYQGEIIYIGKSDSSILSRIASHSVEDKFQPYLKEAEIYYFLTEDSIKTDLLEKCLINKYKPKLNIASKSDADFSEIEVKEPEWINIKALRAKEQRNTAAETKEENKAFEINKRKGYLKIKLSSQRKKLAKIEGQFVRENAAMQFLKEFPSVLNKASEHSSDEYGSMGYWFRLMQPRFDPDLFDSFIPITACGFKTKSREYLHFNITRHICYCEKSHILEYFIKDETVEEIQRYKDVMIKAENKEIARLTQKMTDIKEELTQLQTELIEIDSTGGATNEQTEV